MLSRRTLARLCISAGVCLAFAARVEDVNTEAISIDEETCGLGEWLEMGDSYYSTQADEETRGYAFRIDSACVMTPNEYLERYSSDGTKSAGSDDSDSNVVVATSMTIRNAGSSDGGVMAWQWHMVPSSNCDDYTIDSDLLAHVKPAVAESLQFSVPAGEERSATFPFTGEMNPAYFAAWDERGRPVVRDRAARLVMANLPVRKVFQLQFA